MIELSISVPFMLFFIAGVIDLSGWLNSHITASRVSYELVRYAASTPGINDGIEQQPGEVLQRAQRLLERYDAIESTAWHLDKESSPNAVSVSVSMEHKFIFYPSTTQVRARARSAYLFSGG